MTGEEDRQVAVRLYTETRLAVEDIAGVFGVTRQTIYNWLDDAGVPRRGAGVVLPRGNVIEVLEKLQEDMTALRTEQTTRQDLYVNLLVHLQRSVERLTVMLETWQLALSAATTAAIEEERSTRETEENRGRLT